MTHALDTWFVLADGTHAEPGDVAADKDGVLKHKNGVPVALRENGLPLTSGVATKTNKLAAEAGKEAKKDKAAKVEPDDDRPTAKNRELKAGDGGKKYETR